MTNLMKCNRSVCEGCTSTNAHIPSVIKRERSLSTRPSIMPVLVGDNTSIHEPANNKQNADKENELDDVL